MTAEFWLLDGLSLEIKRRPCDVDVDIDVGGLYVSTSICGRPGPCIPLSQSVCKVLTK